MTKITAMIHDDEYILDCKNHADTVEVCAGISALCYTLAGAVLNHDTALNVRYELEPGYAHIECQSESERVDEDFRCCLIGLMQMEASHPDEIQIVQNVFD